MNQSLSISQTGLHAFQYHMDTISNDIANVNTTGYKAKETIFNALLANTYLDNDKLLLGDGVDLAIQSGTRSGDYAIDFSQGSLVESPGATQFAITGDGYFQIAGRDGQTYYTRDGNFHPNASGVIVNAHNEAVSMSGGMPTVFAPAEGGTLLVVGENKYAAQGAMQLADTEVLVGFLEQSNVNLADAFSQMIVAQRAYAMNLKAAQSADEMMSVINQFKQ